MSKQLSKRTKVRLKQLLENTGDTALKRRALRVIEELNPRDGEKILDVGCGDGYYLYLLSNLGLKLQIVGVDNDPKALDSAKKNLKSKRISLVNADLMEKLPFKSDSFDKAVMSEVSEHLTDDVKGLKQVKRVLRKDGVLILTVPNYNFPFLWDPVNWILQNFFNTHIKSGFWAGIWNQHERLYKPKQIQKVIEKSGFKINKLEKLTFWSLPFSHYIINLGARFMASGGKSSLTFGANKFKKTGKRSLIPQIYFLTAGVVDRLNDLTRCNTGISIFVKALKPSR